MSFTRSRLKRFCYCSSTQRNLVYIISKIYFDLNLIGEITNIPSDRASEVEMHSSLTSLGTGLPNSLLLEIEESTLWTTTKLYTSCYPFFAPINTLSIFAIWVWISAFFRLEINSLVEPLELVTRLTRTSNSWRRDSESHSSRPSIIIIACWQL